MRETEKMRERWRRERETRVAHRIFSGRGGCGGGWRGVGISRMTFVCVYMRHCHAYTSVTGPRVIVTCEL